MQPMVIPSVWPNQSPNPYIRFDADREGSEIGSGVTWTTPSSASIRVLVPVDPAEIGKWFGKLDSLRFMRKGWDGYDAPPPTDRAIRLAQSFISRLLEEKYEPSRLAPSVIGGVGVTHRSERRKVYVEFFNDGKVYALFSDGISEPRTKSVEPGYRSFQGLIGEMREYLDA